MAHTYNRQLRLTKGERNALRVIQAHTLTNISWNEGGSFTKLDGSGRLDKAEIKRAQKGIEIIDFILEITQ